MGSRLIKERNRLIFHFVSTCCSNPISCSICSKIYSTLCLDKPAESGVWGWVNEGAVATVLPSLRRYMVIGWLEGSKALSGPYRHDHTASWWLEALVGGGGGWENRGSHNCPFRDPWCRQPLPIVAQPLYLQKQKRSDWTLTSSTLPPQATGVENSATLQKATKTLSAVGLSYLQRIGLHKKEHSHNARSEVLLNCLTLKALRFL